MLVYTLTNNVDFLEALVLYYIHSLVVEAIEGAVHYIQAILASNKDPVRLSTTEKGPLQLKKD